jgi:coenzyme F420-reducing hydrogenase delta subunit
VIEERMLPKERPGEAGMTYAIFFCQQLDPNEDVNRRVLEREMGPRLRFYPMPCSGRIEALHLLRALEAGADRVWVLACPEPGCRYGQGNSRVRRRLAYARELIREIGLDAERLGLVLVDAPRPRTIETLVRGLLGGDAGGPRPPGADGAAAVRREP